MGCSSTRNYGNHLLKDQDFLAEAFSAENKVHKGVIIDDNNNIQSVKRVSEKNPAFLEEIMDHADESGCVMPWLLNIVPPEEDLNENKEVPAESLKIEHVFGYRSYDVRQNVFFTDDDNVVYTSGSLGIVQNKNTLEQKIFGGLEWDDGGMCHDENITSIAVFRGAVPMIATGQIKMKPVIYVWSPTNPSVVYHTFHQQKGSKEVSRLAFDYKGEYLFSLGRDKSNSFYFFHLGSKSKYWTSRTGENIIFDVAFSPSSSNFCLVGVKTVIFGNYLSKTLENQERVKEDLMDETFTAACYTKSLICLTSTQSGKILIWQNSKYVGEVKVGVSAIHNMHFSPILNYVYVSDSDKKLYTYTFNNSSKEVEKILNLHESLELPSIAKAFDLNSKEEMVMGLKHGLIVLKEVNNPFIKIDKIITKAHYYGKIYGLCYVPDRYILTTGEDNRLMIWNIENKTCEGLAFLDDKYRDLNLSHSTKLHSKSISYCAKLKHIAIGLNNGEVTIRKGVMDPSTKVIPNISMSKTEIELVKYCPNGMFLAVSTKSGEFNILNPLQSYNTVYNLKGHASAIIQLDWDVTSNLIQAISLENEYLYYDVRKETIVQDPLTMRSVKWHEITCKFGYTIQGIFMGSTDPNFINTVALSNSKKLIASGDDDKCLNLYRYPCYKDNPNMKRYFGHSDQLTSVIFTEDDSRIISIAKEDKSIVIWKVNKN